MKENTICIYEILDIKNNKRYVGETKNFRKRTSKHKSNLRRGISNNEFLQTSWDKNKEDNFIFSILEKCKEEELLEKEEFYIIKLNSMYPEGYNLYSRGKLKLNSSYYKEKLSENAAGCGGAKLGSVKSDETKNKFHLYQSGRKKNKKSTSKLVGVYKRENGKFRAEIRFLGIRYNLGTYDNEIDASRAYEKKLKELRKENK